jgi:hypothetical protein
MCGGAVGDPPLLYQGENRIHARCSPSPSPIRITVLLLRAVKEKEEEKRKQKKTIFTVENS